jgi:hypothetical protein
MTRALARHARGEAVVVPVVVRPVDWQDTPLGRLQALPRDGEPVTRWSSPDEAWTDVARGVRAVVQAYRKRTAVRAYGGDASVDGSPVEFAHIAVPGGGEPRWVETPHGLADCEFGAGCTRLFRLHDLVHDADLFLDVTVLNSSDAPVVLSAVGVEFVAVRHIFYVYGIPKAAKIGPSGDVYRIPPPDFADLKPRYDMWGDLEITELNRQAVKRLPDPVHLSPGAPYRYVLHITGYQRNVPNHARLRLTTEAQGRTARSPLLHVFTK